MKLRLTAAHVAGHLDLDLDFIVAADVAPRRVEAREPGVTLDEGIHEETKLTVYLGRQERADRVPAFMAVCDLLHRRGVAGATALLGVDGTAHGERQRASFFSRNARTPMMVRMSFSDLGFQLAGSPAFSSSALSK